MNNEDEFFPENYNHEDVFDEKIHPMLKTIMNICNEYEIPMVCSFQFVNDESKIRLGTVVVAPEKRTCGKISRAAAILLDPDANT